MILLSFFLLLFQLVPLTSEPVWEAGQGFYSTGGALTDIDKDGDLDFLVSNGNDMRREPNHIFFNLGAMLDTSPSWSSADSLLSGHLAVGDVDSDGFPDLAVASLIGPGWTKAKSVMYTNHEGILDSLPSWVQGDSSMSFSCALGDIDGDGDMDLLLASGNRYTGEREPLRVYLNQGGTFESLPSWESEDSFWGADVALGDVNSDGLLDAVLANDGGPNLLFLNLGDSLERIPSWESRDSLGTLQAVLGDINGDSFVDLVVADNAQLQGESRVAIYLNNLGVLDTLPIWVSEDQKTYYSTVSLGDLDRDGDLDLASGGWWEPVVVYENLGGYFYHQPDWSWAPGNSNDLVCEKVTFGRVTVSSLDTLSEYYSLSPGAKVLYLSRIPFEKVISVSLNDTVLERNEYSANPEEGFIVIGPTYPGRLGTLEVTYTYAPYPDLIVTNWEPSRGNFLFSNTQTLVAESRKHNLPRIHISPNPTRGLLTLWDSGLRAWDRGPLRLFDASGRSVMDLMPESKEGAVTLRIPSSLPGGLYFLSVPQEGEEHMEKILYLP